MSEVIVGVDYSNDILRITRGDETLFYGNTWDLDRTNGVADLLVKCGVPARVIEMDIDV